MIYLIDPKDLFGSGVCDLFCKNVAYPLYGIPPCGIYNY